LEDLTKVVEFFEHHPLVTKKRRDFEKFARVISIMQAREHLTGHGLRQIADLAVSMNRRQNREATRILRGHTPDTDR
jgi:hypothetical protein